MHLLHRLRTCPKGDISRMEVHSTKKFLIGIGWLLLGLLLLAMVIVKAFRYPVIDYFQLIILTLFVFFFGITSLLQSFSPPTEISSAEEGAALTAKCNSIGFQAAYFTCFVGLVILLVVTWFVKEIALVYIAVALTGLLLIMWVSQLAARLYYELQSQNKKNKKK